VTTSEIASKYFAGSGGDGDGWREVCTPSPLPVRPLAPPPIQAEMAEMSNPGIKVSRNGQFAVKQ